MLFRSPLPLISPPQTVLTFLALVRVQPSMAAAEIMVTETQQSENQRIASLELTAPANIYLPKSSSLIVPLLVSPLQTTQTTLTLPRLVQAASFLLRKAMLCFIVFHCGLSATVAEEFGISRRIPASISQPSQQVLPCVVRVIAFDSSGQSFGTGSYVGTYEEYGIVLTNWHVIMESRADESLVHVHFPSGFSSFGAIVKSDSQWDLALIVISKPPASIIPLTIAERAPNQGEPLWIAGFGSGLYRIAEGHCVRYIAPIKPEDGSPPLNEILEVSVSARKGDSGGPILNQRGELAGVLFGSDMVRNTAGSYCERVNRFLQAAQREIESLPSRPESYFAAIEKDGPLYSLQKSRNAVPQNVVIQPPQSEDWAGASPLGGRFSFSRRYIAPSQEPTQYQQPAPHPRGFFLRGH